MTYINAMDELLYALEKCNVSESDSINILTSLLEGKNVVDIIFYLKKVGYTNSEANYLIDRYWTENNIKIDRDKYLFEFVKDFKDAKNNKLN